MKEGIVTEGKQTEEGGFDQWKEGQLRFALSYLQTRGWY